MRCNPVSDRESTSFTAKSSLLKVPRQALGTQSMLWTNEYVDAWTQGGSAQRGSNVGGDANAKHFTLRAAMKRAKGDPSPHSKIVARMAMPAPTLWPTTAIPLRGESREILTISSCTVLTTNLAFSSNPECTLPPMKGSLLQTVSCKASPAERTPRMQSTISSISGSSATKKLGKVLCPVVSSRTNLMSSGSKDPMYSAMALFPEQYAALAKAA
mmetsp:Transcript_126808/g.370728  ORF Transcript_126808/g.370728 Transcript_126808/m.370728 type:complete len:214 (+) Transcript_126808:503-1144(+)